MKRLQGIFFLLITTILSTATWCSESDDYSFYIKVGSGVSCSELASLVAVYPPWNPAIQGYDTTIGNCAIAALSVGCEILHILDLEVSVSNRSVFEYRRFQLSTVGSGSYTREFDLSVTPILFSVNFLGRGIPHCNYEVGSQGKIYPMVGAGIGMSNILITNFRTIGLPATGDSSPYESFSSENQYTLRKNFTYTVLAGVEYSHGDRWAIGTGYRWFNAGDFDGPEYLRVTSGSAVDVAGDAWQMRFRAQEWFLEFKIFI